MLDPQTPVGTLVLDHSECATVFAKHRIDYCCKGKTPLVEACRAHGLDVASLVGELETAIARRGTSASVSDPRSLSTREVIVKVIAPHHQFLHRTMPFVRALAQKVARVHGDHEPKLREVATLFGEFEDAMAPHLEQEERELFPALLQNRIADAEPMLRDMRREHEAVGALLTRLRAAAADYEVPEWGCTSYRTLMRELAAVEADTLTHVHVENHVLLPRFLAEAQ